MKRYFRFFCLASLLGALVCTSTFVCATEKNATGRSDAQRSFLLLTSSALEAVDVALKSEGTPTKELGTSKFSIEGSALPESSSENAQEGTSESSEVKPTQIGVKVWFELADGTFVNPLARRWSPKERFYVHVEAAVPLYVSLLQVDPKTGDSTTVYPSEKYENSKKVLQAGSSTRLPVVFAMDDDSNDEMMSLIVVRADWLGVDDELTRNAATSVESRNGRAVVTAELTEAAAGTMKSLCDASLSGKRVNSATIRKNNPEISADRAEEIADAINEDVSFAKFQAIAPAEIKESKNAEDVCFYMLGTSKVGQWTLKIKK